MDDVDDLIERIWGKDREMDLYPELEDAKKQVDGKWQLQHPLCAFDDYEEKNNWFYNGRYDENKKKLEEARKKEDWLAYLRVYDKRHWPTRLTELKATIPAEKWGAVVHDLWIEADEFWNDQDGWRKLALAAKGNPGLMTAAEQKQLADMPEVLTLYRGAQQRNAEGLSWTVSLKWGRLFAYKSMGQVRQGIAKKCDVIAFFDKYDEEKEIIILPEHVQGRDVVPDSRPDVD